MKINNDIVKKVIDIYSPVGNIDDIDKICNIELHIYGKKLGLTYYPNFDEYSSAVFIQKYQPSPGIGYSQVNIDTCFIEKFKDKETAKEYFDELVEKYKDLIPTCSSCGKAL